MMRPLLLLHGALGSKTQLDPLKEALETKGAEVFSMNFSGHSGERFKPTFGIETFADDILSFLKEHELKTIDIFGYSMGGYVALWLALKHPDVVGKIITLGTKFDWSPESAEKEVKKLDPDKIQEKVPAFARILQTRHAPEDWKALLKKTSKMMTDLGVVPLLSPDALSKISHSTLVLLGDQDDMADREYSKQVAHMMPNARFKLLPHTPHPIERINKEELTDTIIHFVS